VVGILDERIGLAEPQPRGRVVRMTSGALLEAREQVTNRRPVGALLGRQSSLLGSPGMGGRRLARAAELPVHHARQGRQAQHGEQPDRAVRTRPCRGPGVPLRGIRGQHPPLDLEARRLRLGLAEQALLALPLQLEELGPIDPKLVLAAAISR
jgi:hypothetical protein